MHLAVLSALAAPRIPAAPPCLKPGPFCSLDPLRFSQTIWRRFRRPIGPGHLPLSHFHAAFVVGRLLASLQGSGGGGGLFWVKAPLWQDYVCAERWQVLVVWVETGWIC